MPSNAISGFHASAKDADQLFALYEKECKAPESAEVLKRAALILLITAWETYVEDLLKEKFLPRLEKATSPKDVESAFITVANRWIAKTRGQNPASLMEWTGVNWKQKVRDHFNAQINTLNTPNSKNCAQLFKLFLDVDLKSFWKWKTYNYISAAKRLDDIVGVRGEITHVARKSTGGVQSRHAVSRPHLTSYILFIKELAAATDNIC